MILIVTCAHIDNDNKKRKDDYLDSVKSYLKYTDYFDRIILLECVSQDIEYLKINDKIEIFYSEKDNIFKNKGINEITHMNKLLNDLFIDENEKIVKITGRYNLINDNFLKFVNTNKFNFIGKKCDDLYSNARSKKAFHTFYMMFTKKIYLDFFNELNVSENEDFLHDISIEWLFYDYIIKKENYGIYVENMGILTNIHYNWISPAKYRKEIC